MSCVTEKKVCFLFSAFLKLGNGVYGAAFEGDLFADDFNHMHGQIGSERVQAHMRTGVGFGENRAGQFPRDGFPSAGIAALSVKSLAGGLNVERPSAAIEIGDAELSGLSGEAGGEAVVQHELHRLVAWQQAGPSSKTLVSRAGALHLASVIG